MSGVNQQWINGLLKLKHADQVTELRKKSAELYRAKHGRDPKDAEERNAALELVTTATESLRSAGGGSRKDGDFLPGFKPLTRAERRAIDDQRERLDSRGW